MRRRELIVLFGSAALAWPAVARAQQPNYRIAILSGNRRTSEPVLVQVLAARGYVEGRNTMLMSWSADSEPQRLPAMAAELVALKPDVIVAAGGPAAEALSKATKTIPIVLWGVGDPVGLGLVENVARPGGNITGITELSTELTAKRLQLLKEAIPSAARIGIIWNATDRAMTLRAEEFAKTAPGLGVEMLPLPVRDAAEIDGVLAGLGTAPPDAIVVVTDPITRRKEAAILEFLTGHGLPSMYEFPDSAKRGALLSYGPNLGELAPRAAEYVDRILKGAKPGDLPLELPNRYYLLVNSRTAGRLGIAVPSAILLRADEVIE
jgi:putative ABC transport system substrate-binding protein